MQLTDHERESLVWKKLSAHFDELLAKAHRDLEKSSLSIEETAALRGRIKLIRQLQSLGSKSQPLAANSDQQF